MFVWDPKYPNFSLKGDNLDPVGFSALHQL